MEGCGEGGCRDGWIRGMPKCNDRGKIAWCEIYGGYNGNWGRAGLRMVGKVTIHIDMSLALYGLSR